MEEDNSQAALRGPAGPRLNSVLQRQMEIEQARES